MKQIHDIRKEFLEKFTEQLILASILPITQHEIYERIRQKLEREMPLSMIRDAGRLAQFAPTKIITLNPPGVQPKSRQTLQPLSVPLPKDFIIDKLDFFIKDKSITMVECPGPGKFILVRRGQITEPTNIILTKEEVDKAVAVFSKAAKIPVIGGTFRVSVGNLTISAIISEITGTRFIIMKRM